MVLLQNDVRQLRSPTKMAATVQLRCYWKQLWSRWAITGSWEPLVLLWLEILSWFLVYGCILMSLYRSSLHFVPVQWFLAELWPLDTMIWDNDLIFGMRVYNHKLQINFEICSGSMIFGQLTAVGLWNLAKYLVVTTLFHYDLRYWFDFCTSRKQSLEGYIGITLSVHPFVHPCTL